jgi:uncharacterized protein (TIRG00374 family)
MQFNWKSLLKLLGPVLFVFLLLRVVDPKQAAQHLKVVRLDIVFLSILLFPIIMFVKTLRWQIICRQINLTIPMGKLYQINYISWFWGNFPLGGISVLSKLVYLKKEGKPVSATFVSISLDKFLDIIGVLIFGLYGFFYFPANIVGKNTLWLFLGIMVCLIASVFILRSKLVGTAKAWLDRYLHHKVRNFGGEIETALKQFWSRFKLNKFFLIFALSICLYLLMSLAFYTLAMALGLHLSFGLVVGCIALIGIVNIVPISANALGTRDAVLLLVLPLAGYSAESALALGFVSFLWATLFKFSGILFWFKYPLPLGSFKAHKKQILP